MSIVVSCPHCGMKFSLDPTSVGKSMQCPNLDCRQTFTVKAPGKPTEPPAAPPPPPPPPPPARKPEPRPPEQAAAPAKPKKPEKPRPVAPPSKPAPPQFTVVEEEVVEAAIIEPPKVKEVVWGEDTNAPPPPPTGKKPVRAVAADAPPQRDQPIFRRKKKKKDRRPLFLIGGMVLIVILIGAGALVMLKRSGEEEAKLATQAEEQYTKKEFATAAKNYEKLAAEYPNSTDNEKYKFYGALANMRVVVESATGRENPEKGFEALKKFIGDHKGSAFAKFEKPGAGADILEAGKKLGDDIVGHAEDQMKKYRENRKENAAELGNAEKTLETGRALLPLLDPFKGTEPFDVLRSGLDRLQGEAKRERDRLAALDKATRDLARVSDTKIQIVESELQAAGILADSEAQALLAAARGRLQELVKYEKDPADATFPPQSAVASILFVSEVGQTRAMPASESGDVAQPAVFLVVARGILYALDEATGTRLWAVRVGPDITEPPTVAKVNLGTGPTELAVVTSNLGGEPAIAGYVVRTGEPRWYQPLTIPDPDQDPNKPEKRIPVPAAGPPVVVGQRLFVPLRDEQGSIYEFDLSTGARRGRIRLAQPAGPATILRAGTGLLYATAAARRIYVIDAPPTETDTTAAEPRCVQVIATGHPHGSLRTAPLIIGPEGDGPGERWLILAQADGPTTMKLRVFAVPPIAPPPSDGKLPPETPAEPAVRPELTVPGWAWFTPSSDGDRLSLVTDAGQFRLFGVKQPSNLDPALFPIPTPPLPMPLPGTAIPGLVLPAEEMSFWVLANGGMQKYRLALIPTRTQELIPISPFVPLGIPTQPPQLNARKDSACLVVRSQNSAGFKAVVVNLSDGAIRWQRQLGVVPTTTPIPHEGGLLLVAEDGGIVLVPAASGAAAGRTVVAPTSWDVASAPPAVTSPTSVAVSRDGKIVFTVTQVLVTENQKPVLKYLIRRVVGGRMEPEKYVTAPTTIAGAPIVLGDSLLIPGADGIVYRHVPGTGATNPDSVVAGPSWGERRSADTVCFLTPLTNTGFLTNDGSKKLTHIEWPKGGNWTPGAGKWELREPPSGPGVVPGATAGEPAQLLIADVTGSVWLYPGDRGGAPVRRWRPGEELPAGKPTSTFAVQTNSPGNVTVAYTVDRKFLVCLNPNDAKAKYVVKVSEDPDSVVIGAPQPAGNGHWLATELSGRVTQFDEATKKPVGVVEMGLPGAVPATVAAMLGSGTVLAPVSDGSAVVLTFPPPPDVLPEPKPKE